MDNKEKLMKHYNKTNEEELFDFLVEKEIKQIQFKESNTSSMKEVNTSSIKEKIAKVSFIDIFILIGIAFSYSFYGLLFDNFIALTIIAVIIAVIFYKFNFKNIGNLFLIPLPILLSIGMLDNGNMSTMNVIHFVLAVGFIIYLTMQYKNNLFYLSFITFSLYLLMTAVADELFLLSIVALLNGTYFFYLWLKEKQYFVGVTSFVAFLIPIMIILKELTDNGDVVSLTTTFIILITSTILLLSKNENDSIWNNINYVLIHIVMYIYLLITALISISYADDVVMDSTMMTLAFSVLVIGIIFSKHLHNLILYNFASFILLSGVLINLISLFEIDNHFAQTFLSLIIFGFYAGFNYLKQIQESYYKFMYYLFTFYIVLKIILVDLENIDFIIRFALSTLISFVFIGIGIYKAIKNRKDN